MYQGKVVEHGRVEDVLGSPQHDYTRQLLEAAQFGDVAAGADLAAGA